MSCMLLAFFVVCFYWGGVQRRGKVQESCLFSFLVFFSSSSFLLLSFFSCTVFLRGNTPQLFIVTVLYCCCNICFPFTGFYSLF